jgi:hypothetical protein
MELYDAARAFMRSRGNTVQWVGGYPSRSLVEAGIDAGEQYVCTVEEDTPRRGCGAPEPCAPSRGAGRGVSSSTRIAATFWFSVAPEPTYARITGGPGWAEGDASFETAPYGVVHRLASDGSAGGVGAFCLEWCLERCGNIRVDTHRSNAVMQALLERLGYVRCGEITLADGTPRDAFQKFS